jgi:hypothetical protein
MPNGAHLSPGRGRGFVECGATPALWRSAHSSTAPLRAAGTRCDPECVLGAELSQQRVHGPINCDAINADHSLDEHFLGELGIGHDRSAGRHAQKERCADPSSAAAAAVGSSVSPRL